MAIAAERILPMPRSPCHGTSLSVSQYVTSYTRQGREMYSRGWNAAQHHLPLENLALRFLGSLGRSAEAMDVQYE
jgi:hypothetical protein